MRSLRILGNPPATPCGSGTEGATVKWEAEEEEEGEVKTAFKAGAPFGGGLGGGGVQQRGCQGLGCEAGWGGGVVGVVVGVRTCHVDSSSILHPGKRT